jgi:Flp pilus assembly protein TadG
MNANIFHRACTGRITGPFGSACCARLQASVTVANQQNGAVVIVFALLLIVILAFFGLALDLGQIYNRKAELQNVSDAAARAAARELIGTKAGINSAIAKAAEAVMRLKYQYDMKSISWSDEAIRFSASPAPDGTWLDAGSARAAADGLLFVKVDTSKLDTDVGAISTILMGVISSSLATVSTSNQSIAGRSMINVTPLAICAQSIVPAENRSNVGPPVKEELVEFGFRRGVAYDLMKLNPGASSPENFVVDPIDPLGSVGLSSNMAATIVGPFVCTGSMPMTRIQGNAITVGRLLKIADFSEQLNSRFDIYGGGMCNPNAAPPDFNIKSFTYTSIAWMTAVPDGQSATPTVGTPLRTVADPTSPLPSSAKAYGPLWSYAKAALFSSYANGVPEPASGYATFTTADWPSLYAPGPVAIAYPASSPYLASGGANFLAPLAAHKPGLRHRRVLNIPLLQCPVAAGAVASARVLAIGKFFMTVPATTTSVIGEFAGIVPEQSLGGAIEVYQ